MKHTLLIALLFISGLSFAQSTTPAPYCMALGNSEYGGGGIIKVSIGTLSHTSPIYFGGYSYYNTTPAPILYRDSSYVLSVTFDSIKHSGPDAGATDNSWYNIAIAFDTTGASFTGSYNFTTNGTVGATAAAVVKTFTVTVPHGAPLTTVRMRIVRYGTAIGAPGAITFCYAIGRNGDIGETKDYNLSIGDIPPTVTTAVPGVSGSSYAVYPNPTTGMLHISAPDGSPVTIVSVVGTLMYSGTLSGQRLDIAHLPAGLYYLNTNGSRSVIAKQ